MKKIILLILCITTQMIQAGDAEFLKSLGFSDNGKYYAYLVDGIADGSGFYWASLGIVDVEKNKYISRETTVLEDDIYNDKVSVNQVESMKKKLVESLKIKTNFYRLGFTDKVNEKLLINRSNYDRSRYLDSVFSTEYWAQGGASVDVPYYELFLKEIPVKISEDDFCYDKSFKIELTMKYNPTFQDQNQKKYLLQKDSIQPRVRRCSYDYSITHVIVKNKSLAVFLKYKTPGFEGPNESYMVITGKL